MPMIKHCSVTYELCAIKDPLDNPSNKRGTIQLAQIGWY
jgi:hypothetical protein